MHPGYCPLTGMMAIPVCENCIFTGKPNIYEPLVTPEMEPSSGPVRNSGNNEDDVKEYHMMRESGDTSKISEEESFRPAKASFTRQEAVQIAKQLGIDFSKEKFDLDQFWKGINVELEHGKRFPNANVTGDDPILTGKIALAHLIEFPDYYTRLAKLEKEAKAYWGRGELW